jgi:UrcA family protein
MPTSRIDSQLEHEPRLSTVRPLVEVSRRLAATKGPCRNETDIRSKLPCNRKRLQAFHGHLFVTEVEGKHEMLSHFARISAAVLSGVTASLLVGTTTTQAAQDRPVVVYGEPQRVNVEHVPYGDLNLVASADRKTLFSRVGSAVRNVCDFDAIGVASDYRACAGLAWKDARPQIDAALAQADRLALNGQSPIAAGAITISARLR